MVRKVCSRFLWAFFFWCRSSSVLELDTQLGAQYLGQCIDKIIHTNKNQIEIQNTFIKVR